MADPDYSVAVVTIPDINDYNPERINYGICSKLVPEFDVALVGPERVSKRIETSFDTETLIRREYQSKWVRRTLLVPLTFLLVYIYVRREQPDVVASFGNLYINGLICASVSKIATSGSVVRITSDFTNLWKYQNGFLSTVGCFVKNNILGRLAVSLADAVIVLGPTMRNKLKNDGVDESKLWEVPQPLHIDTNKTNHLIDVKSQFSIPAKAPVVLFVGYFKRSKGPKRLVRVIECLIDRDNDINVVIVGGSGEYEEYVRQNLSRYDRVHFAGWVPHENLSSYFRTADVLLHPSNTEGLPNVVLEALHYRVPVVATDSGGEVPVYVSNIGEDYLELSRMILARDYVVDPLPEAVQDPENRHRYQRVISSVAAPST